MNSTMFTLMNYFLSFIVYFGKSLCTAMVGAWLLYFHLFATFLVKRSKFHICFHFYFYYFFQSCSAVNLQCFKVKKQFVSLFPSSDSWLPATKIMEENFQKIAKFVARPCFSYSTGPIIFFPPTNCYFLKLNHFLLSDLLEM